MANVKQRDLKDMLEWIDFCIDFCVEKKPNNGEDAEKHSLNRSAALIGVFDGCGGAGAKVCPRFYGKTEAYIASRAVADAFQDWFEQSDPAAANSAEALKQRVLTGLQECMQLVGEESRLVGGISKRFPTTAAAAVCTVGSKRVIEADLFWAGDSRVYLLDDRGLAQLTEDDLGGIDAMQNLTDDGVLTNMVNLSRDFTIHRGHVTIARPSLLFAATDGCFGYLSTPMEFEYLLLETLLGAECVSGDPEGAAQTSEALKKRVGKGWKETLRTRLGEIAGDDYSISGLAFGFGSYEKMRKALLPRANELYKHYIAGIEKKSHREKQELWASYEGNYHRYLCRP